MGETRPDWASHWPLAYPNSINDAGAIAAPLLAAASFTLIGLVVPKAEELRYPSITLCFLVLAALLFVAAVQLLFWARQWMIAPEDVRRWLPNVAEDEELDIQKGHVRAFRLWAGAFVLAYRLGILVLLVGVTFSLVPDNNIDAGRWLAIAIASAGFVAEASWIAAGWILKGSYHMLYYADQYDEPPATANCLQSSEPLRRLARIFIPIARLDLPRPETESKQPPPT